MPPPFSFPRDSPPQLPDPGLLGTTVSFLLSIKFTFYEMILALLGRCSPRSLLNLCEMIDRDCC